MRILMSAALLACTLSVGAEPVQLPSALPAIPAGMQCSDGKTSADCSIQTMVSLRGLPLQNMWTSKRYGELDQALLKLCAEDTRLPDGQTELLVFPHAFATVFDAWKDWSGFGKQLASWRAQSPGSPAQAMVETMYWRAYAWHGRGSGYAYKVPPEAWELFRERMAKATARLRESKALASSCPLWHVLNIDTLIDSSAPPATRNAAYADALRLFPTSQQIHFAMARAMTPKWGGKEGDFDRFARRAIGYTQKAEGTAIYARLYWSEDCNCDDALTFNQADSPDWKLMKAGFDELLKRYPDELYNRNKFASFACRANDRATYTKLRRELGDNIIDSLWPSSWKVDVCDRRMTEKT